MVHKFKIDKLIVGPDDNCLCGVTLVPLFYEKFPNPLILIMPPIVTCGPQKDKFYANEFLPIPFYNEGCTNDELVMKLVLDNIMVTVTNVANQRNVCDLISLFANNDPIAKSGFGYNEGCIIRAKITPNTKWIDSELEFCSPPTEKCKLSAVVQITHAKISKQTLHLMFELISVIVL